MLAPAPLPDFAEDLAAHTRGARFAIGWNERKYDGPEDALYRGMSTFVFDTEGRILDYEGIFDPAKVAAAYARSG